MFILNICLTIFVVSFHLYLCYTQDAICFCMFICYRSLYLPIIRGKDEAMIIGTSGPMLIYVLTVATTVSQKTLKLFYRI